MTSARQFLFGALVVTLLVWVQATGAAEAPKPGTVSCTLIRTVGQLQAMKDNPAGSYCLANDIDASSIANFVPVGTVLNKFTGKFFGNNHVISNLTINTGATDQVGLFGITDHAVIQDVGLVNAKVTGTSFLATVGGLVGYADASSGSSAIARVHVTGQIKCTSNSCNVGGLAGTLISHTTLSESWSSAKVICGTK